MRVLEVIMRNVFVYGEVKYIFDIRCTEESSVTLSLATEKKDNLAIDAVCHELDHVKSLLMEIAQTLQRYSAHNDKKIVLDLINYLFSEAEPEISLAIGPEIIAPLSTIFKVLLDAKIVNEPQEAQGTCDWLRHISDPSIVEYIEYYNFRGVNKYIGMNIQHLKRLMETVNRFNNLKSLLIPYHYATLIKNRQQLNIHPVFSQHEALHIRRPIAWHNIATVGALLKDLEPLLYNHNDRYETITWIYPRICPDGLVESDIIEYLAKKLANLKHLKHISLILVDLELTANDENMLRPFSSFTYAFKSLPNSLSSLEIDYSNLNTFKAEGLPAPGAAPRPHILYPKLSDFKLKTLSLIWNENSNYITEMRAVLSHITDKSSIETLSLRINYRKNITTQDKNYFNTYDIHVIRDFLLACKNLKHLNLTAVPFDFINYTCKQRLVETIAEKKLTSLILYLGRKHLSNNKNSKLLSKYNYKYSADNMSKYVLGGNHVKLFNGTKIITTMSLINSSHNLLPCLSENIFYTLKLSIKNLVVTKLFTYAAAMRPCGLLYILPIELQSYSLPPIMLDEKFYRTSLWLKLLTIHNSKTGLINLALTCKKWFRLLQLELCLQNTLQENSNSEATQDIDNKTNLSLTDITQANNKQDIWLIAFIKQLLGNTASNSADDTRQATVVQPPESPVLDIFLLSEKMTGIASLVCSFLKTVPEPDHSREISIANQSAWRID